LGCAGLLVTMLVVFLRQTKALADRETKTSVTGPGAGG
jgi:hypothetical protein